MLTEERFAKILGMIEDRRTVTIQEIRDELEISESTARRDLNELHAQGRLIKVHGGAVATENGYHLTEDAVTLRKERYREEKMTIARSAAGLVKSGDFVYLDAGSTTELFIDFLKDSKAVFVTNGLNHARKLAEMGVVVYLLGGQYKSVTEALVGPMAVESMEKYHFTKSFMGANGVSISGGFTTPDVNEALVKKTAMSHSDVSYVLADASKFSKISCVTYGGFNEAIVITTKLKEEEYLSCSNVMEVKA